MIEGFALRKIERTYLHPVPMNPPMVPGDLTFEYGEFRKDAPFYVCSLEDSAYVYDPEKKALAKMFVFNAEENDTLTLDMHPYIGHNDGTYTEETYRVRISRVTEETINGVKVKTYSCQNLDEVGLTTYRDYAGISSQVFPDVWGYWPTVDEIEIRGLRCYSDPLIGTTLRFVTDCDCDAHPWIIISGTKRIGDDRDPISLWYSPEGRVLVVQNVGTDEDFRMVLFREDGTPAAQYAGVSADLSDLPAGTYVVSLTDGKGKQLLGTKIRLE